MFQTLGGGPRRFFFRGLVALHELAVTIDPGRVLAHANERRTRPLGSSFLEKQGGIGSRAEPMDQKIPIRRAPSDISLSIGRT
jgi:hypothetical protein